MAAGDWVALRTAMEVLSSSGVVSAAAAAGDVKMTSHVACWRGCASLRAGGWRNRQGWEGAERGCVAGPVGYARRPQMPEIRRDVESDAHGLASTEHEREGQAENGAHPEPRFDVSTRAAIPAEVLETGNGACISGVAERRLPEGMGASEMSQEIEALRDEGSGSSDLLEGDRDPHGTLEALETTPNFKESSQPRVETKRMERQRQGYRPAFIPRIPDGFDLPSNASLVTGCAGRSVGRSLGVDLGDRRTGLAATFKGFAPWPITVLEKSGRKLTNAIMEHAEDQGVDEIIVGLPRSWDYSENQQSYKTVQYAKHLSNVAAEKGWRVYLFDEFNTSKNALTHMLFLGVNKRARQQKSDAYAAMDLLYSYYESEGRGAQLVLPGEPRLRQRLREAAPPLPAAAEEADCVDEDGGM